MSRRALHPTVLLLAATHFMVDGYGNIYAPLLPLLIPRHGMDLKTAGTLAMLFQIAALSASRGMHRSAGNVPLIGNRWPRNRRLFP